MSKFHGQNSNIGRTELCPLRHNRSQLQHIISFFLNLEKQPASIIKRRNDFIELLLTASYNCSPCDYLRVEQEKVNFYIKFLDYENYLGHGNLQQEICPYQVLFGFVLIRSSPLFPVLQVFVFHPLGNDWEKPCQDQFTLIYH